VIQPHPSRRRVDHFETVRVARTVAALRMSLSVAGARRLGRRDRRVEDRATSRSRSAPSPNVSAFLRPRRRARGSRARQPREGRVSRDGVARAQDAAERHPVVDRADDSRPRGSQILDRGLEVVAPQHASAADQTC
jgi:hypothetical protein